VFVQQFQLNRVDLIERIVDDYRRGNSGWLGEESRWFANVPLMYRALAAPTAGGEFVRVPKSGEDFFESNRFTYWASLLHLLTFSFGWQYPALGLEWWVENRRPVDDPRFALIEQTWVADGEFDQFCAWLWAAPSIQMGGGGYSEYEVVLRTPKPQQWFLDVGKRATEGSPFGGGDGIDSMHLKGHFFPLEDVNPHGIELALDPNGEPRGTLIAPTLAGWYAYLRDCEALQRPHPSDRSWRIDVVVKPVGWLGTYRQSRDTGRWFAGPHSLHVIGNHV
jgi:hypothetical protein